MTLKETTFTKTADFVYRQGPDRISELTTKGTDSFIDSAVTGETRAKREKYVSRAKKGLKFLGGAATGFIAYKYGWDLASEAVGGVAAEPLGALSDVVTGNSPSERIGNTAEHSSNIWAEVNEIYDKKGTLLGSAAIAAAISAAGREISDSTEVNDGPSSFDFEVGQVFRLDSDGRLNDVVSGHKLRGRKVSEQYKPILGTDGVPNGMFFNANSGEVIDSDKNTLDGMSVDLDTSEVMEPDGTMEVIPDIYVMKVPGNGLCGVDNPRNPKAANIVYRIKMRQGGLVTDKDGNPMPGVTLNRVENKLYQTSSSPVDRLNANHQFYAVETLHDNLVEGPVVNESNGLYIESLETGALSSDAGNENITYNIDEGLIEVDGIGFINPLTSVESGNTVLRFDADGNLAPVAGSIRTERGSANKWHERTNYPRTEDDPNALGSLRKGKTTLAHEFVGSVQGRAKYRLAGVEREGQKYRPEKKIDNISQDYGLRKKLPFKNYRTKKWNNRNTVRKNRIERRQKRAERFGFKLES